MTGTVPYDAGELWTYVAQYWTRAEWEDFLRGEIYDTLYMEEEQISLRDLLMPADYSLMQQESIDNILTVIKYPRSRAMYYRPESGAHPVTIPKPDKKQIEAYLMVAKSQWQRQVAKFPDVTSIEDSIALQQMVATENELIVEAFTANAGALVEAPDNPGVVTLDDLLKLERAIKVSDTATAGRAGEGGRMTHVLFHPNEMEILQKDERILNNIEEVNPGGGPLTVNPTTSPEQSSAQFYTIRGRPWWLISSNYATAGTIRAWCYSKHLVENVKMDVEIIPFDQALTGDGYDQGNSFFSFLGFGQVPYSAAYNVSMTL